MGKFFVRSKQAAGPEDWRVGLAKPNKQWKTGKSAKALAHSWEKSDGFPPEVNKVFDESGFGVLKEIDLLRGDVEYVVPLPGGAAGSQNDILVHGKSDSNRIVIAVEGKVSEDFGPRVKSWIKKISPQSGKPERLQFLQERLEIESRNVRAIRYQLLHRTASALIEAERFGANCAVMLVHSFSQEDRHIEDYQGFAELFGTSGDVNKVSYAGKKNGIDLYLAWVRGEERFLSK